MDEFTRFATETVLRKHKDNLKSIPGVIDVKVGENGSIIEVIINPSFHVNVPNMLGGVKIVTKMRNLLQITNCSKCNCPHDINEPACPNCSQYEDLNIILPSVIGSPKEIANTTIKIAGLKPVFNGKFTNSVPLIGTVYDTFPKPGATLKRGSQVILLHYVAYPGDMVSCACKKHSIPKKEAAKYNDEWWSLKCLFNKVDKRMPKIIAKFESMENEIKTYRKMRQKFVNMKNFMKQLKCNHCGYPVGNRFHQKDLMIICGKCHHDPAPF